MNNLIKVAAVIFLAAYSSLFSFTALAQLVPSDGNGGGADSVPASGYGTNLWLSISLSNNTVDLLLHNTKPGVPYLIHSRADLASGAWLSEGAVTGTVNATTTPASIGIDGRTNRLFLQAFTWASDGAFRTPPMLAVGGEQIMELTTNGNIISWGGNQYGELGDYTHLNSDDPVYAVGASDIVNIAAAGNHALAIDASGSLWAWGDNSFGQLGIGSTDSTNRLVRVPGMANSVVSAAGSYTHSVAAKADGTVWTWGQNWDGQLGTGSTVATNIPARVQGLTNAVAVAAGFNHTLALLNDGTVWAWGDDALNQLGDGNKKSSFIPIQMPGLAGIAAICAGQNHNLALDTNANVWAWGSFALNSGMRGFLPLGVGRKSAEVGAGETGDWPVLVAGLSNIVGIAVGDSHCLALDSEGRLWAWGRNWSGQLGNGGHDDGTDLPMQVPGMTNIVAIAAGSDASAALDGDGQLWQWGTSDADGTNWVWEDETGLPILAPGYDDFYRGQLPGLAITDGANQALHAGLELDQPLALQVNDAWGLALSNAPVSVEVISGDLELRTVSGGDNFRGLRLTTDADGKISLIAHSDRYLNDTNGLVRVLAASRDQVAEADFNEMLVPLPAVSITSPATGSIYLVGTNQPLAITVQAQAGPGGLIREVDYAYRTNGSGDTALGVSSESPFSFSWTNAMWLTNAFAGRYTLSAVAVDDAGVPSDPQTVTITVALDSEGSGMPDYWQLQYFGLLGVDPGADADGDAVSNLREYLNGTDPTDYYNGASPTIQIVTADRLVEPDQLGLAGWFLPVPLTALVTDGNAVPLTNAPVNIGVVLGTAQPAATTNDIPATNLVVRTDASGLASVWVCFPPEASELENVLSVQAGLTVTNVPIALDSDGEGIADWWTMRFFGHPTGAAEDNSLAGDDADGDGVSNLQEFQQGTGPTDYYNGVLPVLEIMSGNDQSGNYDSFLPRPVLIRVVGTNAVALTNAPVVFTVTNGTALLAASIGDAPAAALALRTDSNGQASAWVYFPPAGTNAPDSTILASASSGDDSTQVTIREFVPLGHWTFNDTNLWIGEAGQLPLRTNNLTGVPGWSGNAVRVESSDPALLAYPVVETNGNANIACQTGSLRFWFRPDWNSGDAGGSGPGTWGRLIEIGQFDPDHHAEGWSLYLDPDGTHLLFGMSTNGGGTTNLCAKISWASNEWYQIALTYSSTGSALYLDGRLLTNGPGVTFDPAAGELTNGFRIGSDSDGNNQAGGAFDELATFDYPLAAADAYTHDGEFPDWWEIYHFGIIGIDPDVSFDGYGNTLRYDYLNGIDPNYIQFSLILPVDPV